MIDWGAGNYERTAAELEPVARAVVAQAGVQPGEWILDLACGTGNAALIAAAQGAHAVGVDAAPRLIEVARQRARNEKLEVDFREGDLLDLPVTRDAVDVVVSVFGVVFASDPVLAVREIARVVRPGGRVLISAWVPAGPINAMLAAVGGVLARVTKTPPPARFPWSDKAAIGDLARDAGLSHEQTISGELAIRDSSAEAYVDAGQQHPVALAMRPVLERANAAEEAKAAMVAVVRDANEDPDAFLVHSPYVVHQLRAA